MSTKHKRSSATSGARFCPEYDINGQKINPTHTKLVVSNTGFGQCVPPDYEEVLDKETKRMHKMQNSNIYKRGDISDLISPYIVNKQQYNLLSHILGTKQVDHMVALNTLSHAGLINSSCPPLNQPYKTEEYIDLRTGRKACREPDVPRKLRSGINVHGCPYKYGDPYALEHYITAFGEGVCRRPVFSGKFSCPVPGGNPNAIKHVTLPGGVGICVEDPQYKKPFIMPKRVVYLDTANEAILEYLDVYDRYKIDLESMIRLNQILTKGAENESLSKIRSALETDPSVVLNNEIARRIKSVKDAKYANYALIHYLRETDPNAYRMYIPTPEKYLNALGIGSEMKKLMMGGSKRNKRSKRSKRSQRSRK